MTNTLACKTPSINERRFHTACRIVEQARDGLVSVLLTGKGEPLLFPEEITQYLQWLQEYRFPLVDLQTNGILLKEAEKSGCLSQWAAFGMTLVCLSVAHWDAEASNNLMGIRGTDYNFYEAIKRVHNAGLAARVNCTLTKSGCGKVDDAIRLIDRCRDAGVEQLTLREVDMPDNAARGSKVREFVEKEKPHELARRIHFYLDTQGATKLMELPHGATIFDVDGQNVCISNCLTSTTDPNDIRQIIFFPDGRIAYDWKYKAARLL
jgi:molybdenum cofactor biosynthesis enzyme MoaA